MKYLIITVFVIVIFGVSYFVGSRIVSSLMDKDTTETSVNIPEKKSITTTIVCGGDVMLSRTVGAKIVAAGDNVLPFKNIAEEFSAVDISFVNLEAPFYDQGPSVTEGIVFKSEPETIAGLKFAGIDIVSLANNHFGNQGQAGMKYTYNYLDENNIAYTGAGNNYTEAHTVKVLEKNGIKFGFLAYNGIAPRSYEATADSAGLAWSHPDEIAADVEKSRPNVDVLLVSIHAGTEYTHTPNENQIVVARRAIDAGADIIVGHHPHVVQTIEKYKEGLIIYSLGNLVFDQMWSQATREGAYVTLNFENKKLKDLKITPVVIENYNQPRKANNEEANKILADMQLDSAELEI
ncbi:MAG: CapA family protein [bacterium]